MTSRITTEFREAFGRLPESVRAVARKNYKLWKDNPRHPSLQFKRVHSAELLYSARVGIGWRVLGLVDDEAEMITWFWIGSHDDYEKLIARFR